MQVWGHERGSVRSPWCVLWPAPATPSPTSLLGPIQPQVHCRWVLGVSVSGGLRLPRPAALGPFVSHDPTDTPRVPPEVAGRVTLHRGCLLPGPMEAVQSLLPYTSRGPLEGVPAQTRPHKASGAHTELRVSPSSAPLPHRLPRCPTVPERDGRPWLRATPSRGRGTGACSHHPSAWVTVRSDPSRWLQGEHGRDL